jgi:hypothetical protein
MIVFVILTLLISTGSLVVVRPATANNVYQPLPYTQDWSNTGLITISDDWSGVPGVIGYRGDGLTSANDVDPQTVLGQESPLVVDVNANQTNPNTFTTGGVAEFQIANPVVALNGSGTADAPYVIFHISATGLQNILVSFILRDLDGSADNAPQQVALQYRLGEAGNFTNLPAGYVADATEGPSLSGKETPVSVTLPADVNNQAQLQIRVITTNASGNDEWVGIDDVSITGSPFSLVINEFSASTAGTDVEYLEVFGSPNTSYAAYTLLEIEGDGTGSGVVDEVVPVGSTDSGGFWLVNLPANALENGSLTLLLAENFSGGVNTDLDTNNDGVFDSTPWTAIVDAVAINDGTAGDLFYSVPVLGPNYDGLSPFAPGGASRIPDGFDTDAATDWVRNDFDLAGIPGFQGTPMEGEAYNTPGAPNQRIVIVDLPPVITITTPVDGAVDVPVADNLVVVFSELVDVVDGAVSIACDGNPVAFSGLPANDITTLTLDPTGDLSYNATCTVLVSAAGVTDNDGTPDPMAADYTFSFITAAPAPVCVALDTPIGWIQGVGPVFDPAYGGTQTVQGVVVGDFEGASPNLRGFYVQNTTDNDDDNPNSSDAIFVFEFDNANRVSLGQVVQVTGSVSEFQGQTQLSSNVVEQCGEGTVEPVDVTLPLPGPDYLERYEGMLVRFPQTLYVTEHFQLGRFGQVVMSSGARLQQPTNVTTPGASALALQAANNLNRIIVDDELNNQNPDPIRFARNGLPLSASNTLRGGDTATGLAGVMTYTWSGNSASGNAYRLRPVNALNSVVNFVDGNPRPASPLDVGGSLKVTGMNLLNFFNTFDGDPDTSDNCILGVGGAFTDCRGADTQSEFDRQWPKTVAAILGTGADVVGVIEMENDGYNADSAIQFLVDRLNDATAPGTYAFIDVDTATGQLNALGTDAIKVGLIYKPVSVTPVGVTAALNLVEFVNGGDTSPRNRPALAQAFEQNSTGARFVVVVNHLKSKGSACDVPDAGDGQGECNLVRLNAANTLLNWLASDPTGVNDSDVLIIGDLNSYALEDPVVALQNGGYTNLISTLVGPDAYSYVFNGQWGYLDHALGSPSIVSQVSGVTEWHINADEPSVLDYNTNFKSPGQIISLYAPDQYRIADHDPVIVGLNLRNDTPVASAGGPYSANEGETVALSASGYDPDGTPVTFAWDLDNDLVFETPGQYATFNALDGTYDYTVNVQVSDETGLTTIASAMVNVVNVAPDLGEITAPLDPVMMDVLVQISANFTDPGVLDTHTALVDWGDGAITDGLVSEVNGSGSVAASHVYTAPGVYAVLLTVTDKDSASDQSMYEYIVVYDPNGGFVTGGGWIDSPAGAYQPDPSLTGKATFGFVAKYKKGASIPEGNTEFQFRVAGLNFKSTSYEWLVVNQGGTNAQFKGSGTINGQGEYKFMIWATDDDPDTFRIKVWYEENGAEVVVYDNGVDQPLGGGSITVHK